jgi:hypothetical protein
MCSFDGCLTDSRAVVEIYSGEESWLIPNFDMRQIGTHHKVRTFKEYHSVRPSSELGLPPTPHPQTSVPPPPCFLGEGNTRWRERGWESPNSDEGHTLWYSLYVRTLWDSRSTFERVTFLGRSSRSGTPVSLYVVSGEI